MGTPSSGQMGYSREGRRDWKTSSTLGATKLLTGSHLPLARLAIMISRKSWSPCFSICVYVSPCTGQCASQRILESLAYRRSWGGKSKNPIPQAQGPWAPSRDLPYRLAHSSRPPYHASGPKPSQCSSPTQTTPQHGTGSGGHNQEKKV